MKLDLTRYDVISMAKEAGLEPYPETHDGFWDAEITELEHFAELIAAAEREACAMVCDSAHNAECAAKKVEKNHLTWSNACSIAIRARAYK